MENSISAAPLRVELGLSLLRNAGPPPASLSSSAVAGALVKNHLRRVESAVTSHKTTTFSAAVARACLTSKVAAVGQRSTQHDKQQAAAPRTLLQHPGGSDGCAQVGSDMDEYVFQSMRDESAIEERLAEKRAVRVAEGMTYAHDLPSISSSATGRNGDGGSGAHFTATSFRALAADQQSSVSHRSGPRRLSKRARSAPLSTPRGADVVCANDYSAAAAEYSNTAQPESSPSTEENSTGQPARSLPHKTHAQLQAPIIATTTSLQTSTTSRRPATAAAGVRGGSQRQSAASTAPSASAFAWTDWTATAVGAVAEDGDFDLMTLDNPCLVGRPVSARRVLHRTLTDLLVRQSAAEYEAAKAALLAAAAEKKKGGGGGAKLTTAKPTGKAAAASSQPASSGNRSTMEGWLSATLQEFASSEMTMRSLSYTSLGTPSAISPGATGQATMISTPAAANATGLIVSRTPAATTNAATVLRVKETQQAQQQQRPLSRQPMTDVLGDIAISAGAIRLQLRVLPPPATSKAAAAASAGSRSSNSSQSALSRADPRQARAEADITAAAVDSPPPLGYHRLAYGGFSAAAMDPRAVALLIESRSQEGHRSASTPATTAAVPPPLTWSECSSTGNGLAVLGSMRRLRRDSMLAAGQEAMEVVGSASSIRPKTSATSSPIAPAVTAGAALTSPRVPPSSNSSCEQASFEARVHRALVPPPFDTATAKRSLFSVPSTVIPRAPAASSNASTAAAAGGLPTRAAATAAVVTALNPNRPSRTADGGSVSSTPVSPAVNGTSSSSSVIAQSALVSRPWSAGGAGPYFQLPMDPLVQEQRRQQIQAASLAAAAKKASRSGSAKSTRSSRVSRPKSAASVAREQ